MADLLYNILLCVRDFFVWVLLGAFVLGFLIDQWELLKDCNRVYDEKKEKPPRKLTKKERKRIEKAIDDAYKRMR